MSPPTGAPSPPALGPRSGIVALVGRPNAGKSTLMNRLLAEKVAIVSDKPQTTRQRLVGILSNERGQMVFYDTPGVHKPQHAMNRNMVKSAQEALSDADAVCLLVDALEPAGGGDRFMLEWVRHSDAPIVVVLNKVDCLRDKSRLLPRIEAYAAAGFQEVVPISALAGDGVDRLLELLWGFLPEGPPLYDPELLTPHPERFLVAERIREKVLEMAREELPFSVAVTLDKWEERPGQDLVAIHASILVEREGQKKILVGSGGQAIKAIGIAARRDLEPYLERRVFLDLTVRVEKDWRESPRILSELERAPYAIGSD